MMTFLKKIGTGVGMGLAFAVIIRILIPIPIRLVFAIVLAGAVAELICEQVEKDSATKRMAKRLALVAVAIGAFIAFRVAAGQLFGMPVTAGVASFFGDKVKPGEFQAAVLELLFLLPGAGLAYAVAYGGKARNLAIGLAVLGFFLVLWQVKQPQNAQSAGLRSQSFINWTTRANNQAAAKTTTKKSWGIATSKVPRVYRITLDEKGEPQPPEIVKGLSLTDQEVVKLSSTPPVVYQDQGFVAFRVWDALTGIKDSEELWAEAEAIEPLDAVEYQDGKIVPARPQKASNTTQPADKLISFEPGQRVETGVIVYPGCTVIFYGATAPFTFSGHQVRGSEKFKVDQYGQVTIYGLDRAGQVYVRAVN
ncbi:MAG TPA: hypothetical protein PK619_01675 [bacterium]|nr:hypothetical protein [bacterium]HPW39407.1 hypothetical protein [bacterium]